MDAQDPSANADQVNAEAALRQDALVFDREDLVERLMGNEALARRVAGAFVDSMPMQLASLAKAISSFDAPATMLEAHSIKGAAANVGTISLQKLASKLEQLGKSGDVMAASKLLPELDATFRALKPELQSFCNSKS